MLVVEVAIERADRDTGAIGDLRRPDRVVAELAKQLGRGLDERLVASPRSLLAKLRTLRATRHPHRMPLTSRSAKAKLETRFTFEEPSRWCTPLKRWPVRRSRCSRRPSTSPIRGATRRLARSCATSTTRPRAADLRRRVAVADRRRSREADGA